MSELQNLAGNNTAQERGVSRDGGAAAPGRSLIYCFVSDHRLGIERRGRYIGKQGIHQAATGRRRTAIATYAALLPSIVASEVLKFTHTKSRNTDTGSGEV